MYKVYTCQSYVTDLNVTCLIRLFVKSFDTFEAAKEYIESAKEYSCYEILGGEK